MISQTNRVSILQDKRKKTHFWNLPFVVQRIAFQFLHGEFAYTCLSGQPETRISCSTAGSSESLDLRGKFFWYFVAVSWWFCIFYFGFVAWIFAPFRLV